MNAFLLPLLIITFCLSAGAQQLFFKEPSTVPGVMPVCQLVDPRIKSGTVRFLVREGNCINGYAHDPAVVEVQRSQAAKYREANRDKDVVPEIHSDRVYAVPAGGYWHFVFLVTRPAYYSGSFEARDDSSDLTETVLDAAGRYVKVKPKDEIEIIVMEDVQFLQGFSRGRAWSGPYSSGRKFNGEFRVLLMPGWYRLVINNNFSFAKAKSVRLQLHQPEADL